MATPSPLAAVLVVNGMMDGVGGSEDVAPSDEETGNVKLAFEPEGNAHLWLGLVTEIDESSRLLLLLFPSD